MIKPAILHLEGVTKQFAPTAAPVLRDVTLTLHQGELLGLLGPSGCGKTTLLRMIAGFERPQSGTVELAGSVIAGAQRWVPPEKRATGMVFQDYALFPHLSVFENVGFGVKNKPHQQRRESVESAIALVGLTGFEKRYPHELSGGQQQRVALARALAPRPALILLDEPLSNLDVQVRLRLRQDVRTILKDTGISAIFVTHDQEEALSISDRIGVMCGGYLEQVGTPEEIYTNPASRFVAEFVTQANFLPARRRGHLWETEVGTFAIAQANIISACGCDSLDAGELMLREENVILKPDEDSQIVIRDRQFLGREYRYCLQTGSGKRIHARTPLNTQLAIGTRVQLAISDPSVPIFPKVKR